MKDNRIFGYCKTCKYYEKIEAIRYEDIILEPEKHYCNHPLLDIDDPFIWAGLEMSETDYCSRFDDTED